MIRPILFMCMLSAKFVRPNFLSLLMIIIQGLSTTLFYAHYTKKPDGGG